MQKRQIIHITGQPTNGIQRCMRCRCRLSDATSHWPSARAVIYTRQGAHLLGQSEPPPPDARPCRTH